MGGRNALVKFSMFPERFSNEASRSVNWLMHSLPNALGGYTPMKIMVQVQYTVRNVDIIARILCTGTHTLSARSIRYLESVANSLPFMASPSQEVWAD